MMSREIFNRLHRELSLLKEELVPRMLLWEAVGEVADPTSLTKEQAVAFLREGAAAFLPKVSERKRRRMIKKFKRWNPDSDTPEEIFERMSGGGSRDI